MTTGTSTTTETGRKIRGDAKLERLTAEQHEYVRYWLGEENCIYSEVVRLVSKTFGVEVSKSSVGVYYQRQIAPTCDLEVAAAAAVLAALPTDLFDAATINHAKALAFNALVNPNPMVDSAAKLLDLVRRAEKQEIARERIPLEKRRVALREALAAHPPRQPRASTPERSRLTRRAPRSPPQMPRTTPSLPRPPPPLLLSSPPSVLRALCLPILLTSPAPHHSSPRSPPILRSLRALLFNPFLKKSRKILVYFQPRPVSPSLPRRSK